MRLFAFHYNRPMPLRGVRSSGVAPPPARRSHRAAGLAALETPPQMNRRTRRLRRHRRRDQRLRREWTRAAQRLGGGTFAIGGPWQTITFESIREAAEDVGITFTVLRRWG